MKTKLVGTILIIAMLSMILPPALAWNYGNPVRPDDLNYEEFGPRADKLLMPLFAAADPAEFFALQTGKIDVTDSPLTDFWLNTFTTPPLNNSISVKAYGPEFGLYLFDLNQNNNTYLGNPPNPLYPNPIYIGPNVGNPMAEPVLRKAVAYVTDRPLYVMNNGPITTLGVYTVLGSNDLGISPWGKYTNWDITAAGARSDLCYLFNRVAASAILNASGLFPYVGGFRTYKGVPFTLKIVARVDDPCRAFAASDLNNELMLLGFRTSLVYANLAAAKLQVVTNKNFHIYTGAWCLTATPDFLFLWNWYFYWHPGRPNNYAGCNDPAFNMDSDNLDYANTQADAVFWAWKAQVDFATNVLAVPLWLHMGFKAVSRTYTGGNNGVPVSPDDGENIYRGLYWQGFVNVAGYGMDNPESFDHLRSCLTFLNMHPEGFDWGNGNMTIRYGFSVPELNQLNPIYSICQWDNNVLDLIGYESLLTRNPYNLAEYRPWVARSFSVSTYMNPVLGTCTKLVFTLRDDVFWQDGTPVTIADIYFTFVEIDDILRSRGLAPPWWAHNVLDILSFRILDPCNFEVLLDVKSIFAIDWVGLERILPKHIWKPIVTAGDPTTFAPDPNLIGNGAWRLAAYVPWSYILLVANKAGSVVTTGLAGSVPITSPQGYFKYLPVDKFFEVVDPTIYAYAQKLPPEDHSPTYPAPVVDLTFNLTINNLFAVNPINDYLTVEVNGTTVPGFPKTTIIPPQQRWNLLDIEMIVDDFYGGYSWYSWNGTHLEYNKYLFFEAENPGWNLTWNKAVVQHFPDTTVECYVVRIYEEFQPIGVYPFLPTNFPINTKFHSDLEWFISTSKADISGSNWYTDMSKILTLPPGLALPLNNPTNPWANNLANYPYKTELPTPNGVVDGKDLTAVAAAFGSYPGHPRWNMGIADINGDYKVDGKDVTLIAKNFGWPGAGED
jgi:hypothetical protein